MAYSEEQRPEAQLGNQNRNSLNIQQPGETDSYEAFFSDPNRWKDNSTSFSLGDVLPTMGKGFAQSVRGTGEMARGLGDAMIQSPVKTGARILNEFSRMGLPGVATVQDIFAGGSRGADEVIDTLPDGKNAVTDTVGKGLKATGKAVSDGAKASDEWLTDNMSPGAVRALNTPMSEGYDDPAVWLTKGMNFVGAVAADVFAGGVAKKVGDVTLRKMLTAGLEKKYIAAGLQPERATALAAEAVDKKMPDLFRAGLITHSTASAQGQSAMAAADAVLNADYSELAQSPKFQQTFLSIDADPQHAQLTDRQKMDLAKERVADEVRAQLATDPELLAVNAMAAKLGDAQLFNLVTRGTAKTVKSGIVRNATEQGAINAAQGGYSRYQENTALRETAGMDVSPWEGVADATIEGAAFGAAMGAPFGAVAGYRGRRQAAEETAMRDAETVQQDDAAPQPESVDPVAQQRESMQGMNREQLLEQYADADMAPDDKIRFDVYRNTRSGDIFIAYGKNKMRVRGGFKSASDARKYIDSHRDELVRHVKDMREISREEQRNATNRDRTGPERRKGDVSPEQFSDAFGFRGVQFGNYVEGPRRQADLNRAYDSLHDLAEVLNVPTKALSLNGRLGLAFGARGKGKAAAHYESGEVAINLTKGNGPGALAHEWFHSLDNYFGRYDVSSDGKITSGGDFMTEAQRVRRIFKDGRYVDAEYPVRQEVYDAFKGVIQAIKNSDMPRRSAFLDEVRSKPYWSTDVEMAARAFERYVQDKARTAGVENDYLVNIRKAPEHNTDNTWAYPTNAELDGGIREAFDHLFRTLKTRETDKGVAFYSRKGVTRTPEGNLISDVNRSAEAKGSPVPQVEAVARGVMSGIKDSDLKVRVVKSQKEAEALAGESFDGYGRVHAFYRPDKREIVLVADNIPDGRTVREKLRHEIIHHAMEHVVTPAEYQTIIKTVLKTRDSDNATIREAWRKVDASYGKESPEVQAGEFLAHMAEKQPNKFVAAWERVVALVKGVLCRTGLLKPTELNDIRLVRETIRTLGQRVREGYTPREDGAGASSQYSRSGKPDPFKVPEGEGERYRDDLARMMKSLRTTDLTVNIGRTPPVLRHLGAPDLPLVISRDTVRKATNGVKHVVPMDVIERLPELMHDPDAIYRSATERNAVVMLLDAVDKNGDPVVSAVHMKATQKLLEVNRIASVYGTENGKKLKSMEMAGLTLYRREKLNPDGSLYRGLQLPKDEHSRQGSADKILYPEDIRKGPYYSRTSSLTPEETIASRFVRQMQDKFQVLKAVQENIRKTGGKIDDSNNAYMAEELFHGKAENDLNVMKERYVQPLAKLLADYKIAQADLDEYLYARHAPERNAHIAKINPKMPDGGSGMTNAEAAEIMQRVRNSGKQAQYDRLAGIVDDMLARRRELIREAGLEESGVVDAWQKAYRYYVPLKGQDVDGVVSLPRTGKGFTIGGRESKQAMGRASRAQSPSTQAIQDLSESLIRNRKNEVGNAFLKLVQDNPDKDYWQVFTDDRPDTMRTIAERKDQETGETIREVVERPVPMAMMADRYFTTKKNGKTYYIKLHDPRLMRAMKNMGPETSNAVIRTLGKVNRFLATVNTSYNPEFLVSNFIRDVQTAVMNLKAEQGRSDGKLKGLDNLSALAVVKDSRSAMSAVYASLRGKTLTGNGAQWQKVWKEFVEDGGKTGWFNMGDLEGQQKEMDRLVSLAKGGWKGQSIGAWNSFLNLVEDANGAVENALRLSAYKHARDAGLSRQQAASLAKNMTVNFNRRGEQGALMNSLYMFANASIQGTANLVRTLGHLNGDGPLLERLRWKNLNVPQKIALAAVGAGYLLGSLNRSVAGEDDDGVNWYDKVPSHVKERNLVIMKSVFGGKAGEYWSIPLPYGYNVFFLLGHTAEGVAAGDLTASRAAGNVVGGVLGAFSPIGSETSETLSGALLKNAAPTILRPFANLAMNENFMGAQIYQENMPFGTPKPDSQLGRRSTPEAYKAFASWLNAFSGGSQYRSGAVDITPESLKYWVDYISGGTGRFISKTTDAAVKSLNGIDIPEQQVPFLGKISGEVMPYADQQKMYDRMTEVAQYHAELKSLTGAERTAFIDENNGKLSMNGLMQDTRKRLKDLRKQRDAIYADSTLSLAQQSAMVKSVERDMKIAVDRFNREYNKKVGVD